MTPDLPHGEIPSGAPLAAAPASGQKPASPAVDEAVPASQLTPEEQMALFEKELKETDWGHQPC